MTSLLGQLRYVLYRAANKYTKSYEGFSYDFAKNGELHLLKTLPLPNDPIVFDVGANIGEWSKSCLARFPNARLHCFELSKDTFATLESNLVGTPNVTLNNFGLSNDDGEVEYLDFGINSGVNTLVSNSGFHDARQNYIKKSAKVLRGDTYCSDRQIDHIDLLKIDVEGAEYFVLQGFSEMLRQGAVSVIQFEYGYVNADTGKLMKDFFQMLQASGYIVGPLKPQGVLFMDFDYGLNDFKSGPNFVAVHSSCSTVVDAIRGTEIAGYPSR